MGQRGAFILGQVHNKQLSTYTQTVPSSPAGSNTGTIYTSINTWDLGNAGTYGWFGGGYVPGASSTVDRIDFANDSPTSASPRGLLSQARGYISATGNASYGWFAGGTAVPGSISTVNRIDYSNDSPTSASVRGPLLIARYALAATGNANYGWFGGGQIPTPNFMGSNVERIDYSNDSPTSASPRGFLSLARTEPGATSNNNYGWWAGGWFPAGPATYTTIDRVDFSNDSPASASPRNPLLSQTKYGTAGFGNANFGWFAGGIGGGPASPAASSYVDRIDYSNDSSTAGTSIRGLLIVARGEAAGSANSAFGWVGGGNVFLGSRSLVERIDFANDTVSATTRGPLSQTRYGLGGTSNYVKTVPSLQYPTQGQGSNQSTAGYGWAVGGRNPALLSNIDRIDFANDSPTSASPRGNLLNIRAQHAAIGNAVYSWIGGGSFDGVTANSSVERIDFANDSPTGASPRGFLSRARRHISATGNSNYGWWGGGYAPGNVSTVDRIDFANDSPTGASLRGPLSLARYGIVATGNADYGWFAGGATPSSSGVVDRVDFSNDSPTSSSARGFLTTARHYIGAASNANYGWFAGGADGATAVSIVDRIDFANDSPTSASPRGQLVTARQASPGAGNAFYGWFGGGITPGSVYISSTERIDYSNDSPTAASVRGPLTAAKGYLGGVSNYVRPSLGQQTVQQPFIGGQTVGTYGWVVGGTIGGTSTVERIDFANDSPTTANARGNLIVPQAFQEGLNNNQYGWHGGGQGTGPVILAVIQRITFSNDTSVSTIRASLNVARIQTRGSGNTNYGWFAGGNPTSTLSLVERIDYANDNVALTLRGNLITARQGHSGMGNNNYGWYAGHASTPGSLSSVERKDYSNDLVTGSTRGPLTAAKGYGSATSNENYGWFVGGIFPTGLSTVERIDFANDSPTSAVARGNLPTARVGIAGLGSKFYGWITGGNNSSIVDRIDYSNDTAAASTRGTLGTARYFGGANSNYVQTTPIFNVTQYYKGSGTVSTGAGTYGWFGGGVDVGSSPVTNLSNIDRIDFSNDSPTSTSSRGGLPTARYYLGGVANANYGWFAGGVASSVFSTVERIDFANDSPTTANVRGTLLSTRWALAATGNANYGWFGGGWAPAVASSVERINYANDSPASASPRGPLNSARYALAATSNANYGWFGGGYAQPTTARVSWVERVDFSNDSPTAASPRGLLSAARQGLSATSNANYGWFAGGVNPGNSVVSTVDRIDFSNDSPTSASARGPLATSVQIRGASGNANYGWFGGGRTTFAGPVVISAVDRIDFSNDSPATASIRGTLSSIRGGLAGTSNYVQ